MTTLVNTVIGYPLDLIFSMLEDDKFCKLWMTGDKILQLRIKNSPRKCEDFPCAFPSNVISISDARVVTVFGTSDVIFTHRVDGLEECHVASRFPHTLRRLSVECDAIVWPKLSAVLKTLPVLDTLKVTINNGDNSNGKKFIGFPESLTSLRLVKFGDETLADVQKLPNLTELSLVRSFSCKNETWGHGLYDLSRANLKNISSECRYCKIAFPSHVETIIYKGDLHGDFPNIAHVSARSIKGSYPVAELLFASSSADLSGCNPNCKIRVGESHYESGHLELCSVDDVDSFSGLPVKKVTLNFYTDSPDEDNVRHILEVLQHLTSMEIWSYEEVRSKVESGKVKITYNLLKNYAGGFSFDYVDYLTEDEEIEFQDEHHAVFEEILDD